MRAENGSDKSTQVLVEDTIAGNTEAFSRLVDRYRDAASAVAYSYFGGFDDVQDAVQEAFVHAYCNLRQLREPAKFGPWLRRITSNSCAMALRKRERSNVSLDQVAEQASTSDDPRKIAARVVVREALSKLSDAARLTVTLSYINGYSHGEIAEFLEVPLTTVRSRLRQAKRKLRKEMIEMVNDVLHEDKPEEELVRKILGNAVRVLNAIIADSKNEALRHCDEALAAIKDLGRSRTPQELRELLVRALESEEQFRGDNDWALRKLKAWPVEEIKSREQADILITKGDVMLLQGDVVEAKALFDQATDLVGAMSQDARDEIVEKIGHSYHNSHQSKLARDYLLKAVEAARRADSVIKEAMNLYALANTYLDDGEPALAKPLYERAHMLFTEANRSERAVMVQATLDLVDDVGEQRWGSLVQWLAFCLPLRKAGDVIEVTERGGGWGSRPHEPVWKPEVGVLYRIDGFGKLFDASVPAGTTWRGGGKWLADGLVRTTTTILGCEESLETTLGRFSDCLLLQTVVQDALKGDETEQAKSRALGFCGKRSFWFARGIGLVRFFTESREGSVSIVDLRDYEIVDPSNDHLPLALGNSWTYGWVDAPEGHVATERYRVAANEAEHWYLENYRYVLKSP